MMATTMGWVFIVSLVLCFTDTIAEDLPWWKTAILYQVYPRSFKDSDGDGIGDLRGISEKVDYLKEIGVEAIWMNPIYPSPLVDFGYDVSNYIAIDPVFGTMDDLKGMMRVFQRKGIKVIMDFVPNHSSDQHPWFLNSVKRIDPYTDYYIWADGTYDPTTGIHTPPNNWVSLFSGSAWEWNNDRQQFYYHVFTKQQPDLNFRNPNVVDEMEKVIKFWMDIGVDGLRLDATKYMYETRNLSINEPLLPGRPGTHWLDYEHTYRENLPESFDICSRWGEIAYDYSKRPGGKQRALFVEVYSDLASTMKFFGRNASIPMAPFSFEILLRGSRSTRTLTIKEAIENWMTYLPEGAATPWVAGNHDRPRLSDLYGPEMADTFTLVIGTLPGLQCVYYGDEIGMQGTFTRWDQTQDTLALLVGESDYLRYTRDPVRSPMQWDSTPPSSGFSTNSSTWLPVNPNYWWLNVEAQQSAQSSHLKVFQAMAKVRKDPVLQRGDLQVLAPDNDTLLIVRSYNSSYYVLLSYWGSLDRNYTSENLFTRNYLDMDMDMEVVIVSVNVYGHKTGDVMHGKSTNLRMRPKSSILLRSVKGTPSSAADISSNLFLSITMSFFCILYLFHDS